MSIFRLKKRVSKVVFLAVCISIFFNLPLIAKSQPEDAVCTVEITGGPFDNPAKMYPGQKAQFTANITNNFSDNIMYTWTVDGPIIKAYDDRTDHPDPSQVSEARGIEKPIPMSPDDFNKQSIEFYWQLNGTDTDRTVTVRVQTPDGECEASRILI